MLQSKAGYIDARPLTASSAKPLATRGRTIHWVKLRNTRNAQIFSALAPITDILGGRLARLSSGGRECFHSISARRSLAMRPFCTTDFQILRSGVVSSFPEGIIVILRLR